MKKIFFVLFIAVSGIGLNFSQENPQNTGLYTFFVNVVGGQFPFPLVGLVNIAGGDQDMPQIGQINWTERHFSSLQAGFINVTGGGFKGFQTGFLNAAAGDMGGFQLGFSNTSGGEHARGLQLGFANAAANDISGAQISFFNTAKRLTGLQLGFINYVDTIEAGVPVGFISIVRNGGYRAVELGLSETMPTILSFKIGLRKFYTSLHIAYRPAQTGIDRQIFSGFGLGSIMDINKLFFINPELVFSSGFVNNSQSYLSFVPSFGYNIAPYMGILFGPSMVWAYREHDMNAFTKLLSHRINGSNVLYFGGRTALRFRL